VFVQSLGHDGAGSHVPVQLPWLVAMPAETQLFDPVVDPVGRLRSACRARSSCALRTAAAAFRTFSGASTMHGANRDVVREDCPRLPSTYIDRF